MSSIWGQASPTGVTGYATTTETSTNYGVWFTVAKAGTLTGIWFYSHSGATTLPTGTALFTQTAQGTGTLIASNASPTWSGAAGSGWVQDTSFPSTAVTTGNVYAATYYAGSGGLAQSYIYTGSSPAAWFPTTSADSNITAPESEFSQMNGPYQGGGTYQTLPSSNNASNLNWLVDVNITFAAAGTVAPVPPRIPHPLWFELLEVAQTRADWQAQGVASPTAQTWRLMDGAQGRPGNGPGTATANSTPTTLGTKFYVTQGGMWFEGYWWWVCASGSQPATPQKFALWSWVSSGGVTGTGTVVPGSVVTSGALSAGWNYIPLAAPVQLGIGGTYTAATGTSGPYPDTTGQFGGGNPYSAGITSGPLSCFSDSAGSNPPPDNNGAQPLSTAGGDPSLYQPIINTGNHDNFWLDVQVTAQAPAGYQGSYRLWPNMTDADYATTNDASVNYVIGTEIIVSHPSVVNAIWYYIPNGQGSSNNQWATSADVWNVRTKARVATQQNPVWLKPVTGGVDGNSNSGRWVYTQLPGTVTLQPGDYYVTVYNSNASPNGWGAKSLGYWQASTQGRGTPDGSYQKSPAAPAGITSGPLYAPTTPAASDIQDYEHPATIEPGQAVFAVGPPNQFPNAYVGGSSGGGTGPNLFQNYWVDLEVTLASTFTPAQPDLPQQIPHPLFYELLEVAEQRMQPDSGTESGVTCTGSVALAPMGVAGSAAAASPATPPATPGLSWQRAFQPWRRAATERVQPPVVITATGSAALAPMAVSGSATAASPASPPAAAMPGAAWTRVFQPWRRAAAVRVQPPVVVTASGSAALAPMAVSGSVTGSPELAPAAALPGPAWKVAFQPWRKAAQQRIQPPAVIVASGSAALAPLAVSGTESASSELPFAAALPGPAWRIAFQPWRRAAGIRLQPPPVITASGSAALAPMAVTGTVTGSPELAPSAALPGASWRRAFQPWRRAAAIRVQPPSVAPTAGSVALAPMAASGTAQVSTPASPPATPGPAWQRVFQPWKRAAGARVQPAPVITCTGSAALAPMAVSGSVTEPSSLTLSPPAALPGPSWRRQFQPWRRAAAARIQPPGIITISGSAALAPMAVSAADVVSAVATPPALPGPAWRRRFQPWRKAVQQQQMPPPVIAATGSAALAPMAVAASVSIATEIPPAAALPGPAWRRVFQPWRKAAQVRVQPPVVVTASGSAALAPMAAAGTGSLFSPSPPAAALPGPAWRRVFQLRRRPAGALIQLAPVTCTGSAALAPMGTGGTVAGVPAYIAGLGGTAASAGTYGGTGTAADTYGGTA